MKRKIVLLLTLILSAVASFAFSACGNGKENTKPANGTVSALSGESLTNGNYVRWIGRTEYSAANECVYCYYTATGFTVSFTGTKLDVTFKATNTSSDINRPYFIASTDGEAAPEGKSFSLTQEIQTVTVASGLSNGKHTVTVLKRSEPENSLTSVLKIKTDGELQKPKAHTGLKFQILGGSGISGHGCLGQPEEDWTTENSSSLNGFGYLAAKKFGAECQFVSNSGMGLLWGYRGVANLSSAYEAAGLVAEYNSNGSTKSVNPVGQWNHQSWAPDAVIINIGGNDWNSRIDKLSGAERTEAEEQFKTEVVSFLNRIHTLYPEAYVVWTCNSSTSGNGGLANTAIKTLEFKNLIEVVAIDNSKDGADDHASEATQTANAKRVADAITRAFGIKQV